MGMYVDRNFIKSLSKKYYQQQKNRAFEYDCICLSTLPELASREKKMVV